MTNTSIFAAFERMWQHITVALNGKSDIFHNHDDKYYTQEHVDENFALKSDLQNLDLSDYETKSDAQEKLSESKTYTDTVADGKADKTQVATDISNAVKAEENRAKEEETRIEGLITSEIERAIGVESGLQTQINTIMNNPDAEQAINSINEFSAWVDEHGTIAEGMRVDINKNKDDISAIDTAYKNADSAMSSRLDVLEAINHEHSNKSELDLIVSGDKEKWDNAVAISHEHGNKTVLDGITADNITSWNTITSKVSQSDLTSVSNRVTALEDWHENFIEFSQADIDSLFA